MASTSYCQNSIHVLRSWISNLEPELTPNSSVSLLMLYALYPSLIPSHIRPHPWGPGVPHQHRMLEKCHASL